MENYNGKKLVVFGDSIMYGSGNDGVGVGEYLAKDFGFNLKKYCVGGARTGFMEGKNWLVEQVRQAINDKIQADLIVFNGFTNDCNMTDGKTCDVPFGDIPEIATDIFKVEKAGSTFSGCFKSVADAFKRYFPKAKVIFVRPHRMGRRDDKAQKEYGERAVAICKEYGFGVVDIYAEGKMDTFNAEDRDKYTFDSYGWGRGDCTHPNADGYLKFYMPVIKRLIKEIL